MKSGVFALFTYFILFFREGPEVGQHGELSLFGRTRQEYVSGVLAGMVPEE